MITDNKNLFFSMIALFILDIKMDYMSGRQALQYKGKTKILELLRLPLDNVQKSAHPAGA